MMRWVFRSVAVSLTFALAAATGAFAAPEDTPTVEIAGAPVSIEELAKELSVFRIESLSSADHRAVLSLGEDLFLLRPGDKLPGIGWNRVVSVHPDRLLVALPSSRTAVVIALPDGRQRIDWIDGNLPLSPPLQQPIYWTQTPEISDPGVKVRRFSDLQGQLQAQDREETP